MRLKEPPMVLARYDSNSWAYELLGLATLDSNIDRSSFCRRKAQTITASRFATVQLHVDLLQFVGYSIPC